MVDEVDNTDKFIDQGIESPVNLSRIKLLSRDLVPMGACHYCSEKDGIGSNQLYCDGVCANAHAHELKRLKEIGR